MAKEFQVRSNKGKTYTVVEVESRIPTSHLGSTTHEALKGLSDFRLKGGPVHRAERRRSIRTPKRRDPSARLVRPVLRNYSMPQSTRLS